MSQLSHNAAEARASDGDDVARDLRRQIEAVKAQVQAHREVMQAAGLAAAAPPRTHGDSDEHA